MADFVARARTPVKREGRTGVVDYVPVPEVGTRLVGQLMQLARGIAAAREQQDVDDDIFDLEDVSELSPSRGRGQSGKNKSGRQDRS